MGEASIPVDLSNPGQVFACMGFLEAAEVLCGGAEGGFDWTGTGLGRFELRSGGAGCITETVIDFVAEAKITETKPEGEFPGPRLEIKVDKKGEEKLPMDRPIALSGPHNCAVLLTHWVDGSSREPFKLYAGNRAAVGIARELQSELRKRWRSGRAELLADPFAPQPLGGTFNFDARKTWTRLDAGYSPNDQEQAVLGSAVVELLAAWGLENARPGVQGREACYGVWSGSLPPLLARAALGGMPVGRELRLFRFRLAVSGKNKNVTFARQEGEI